MRNTVQKIVQKAGNDRGRLMDILLEIQAELGYVSGEVTDQLAEELGISRVDVEQTLSFYHFFRQEPRGEYTVYLNNSLVANMMGRVEVAAAFEKEAGCKFGSVTEDGRIGLFETADIGMNDQEPAALINGKVFTNLTPLVVRELVSGMRNGKKVEDMIRNYGDGKNGSDLVRAMVHNNIKQKGSVLFSAYSPGEGLTKALQMSPEKVISEVKDSYLRGRGGAGFPTGLKWEFCRRANKEVSYVFCNADEGEPGTFKERVLLTEYPHLIFEGMAISGYAIGAKHGVLYLRNEYDYLKAYLESVLEEMHEKKLLGDRILDTEEFGFDIRIQMGAGAYVCGEESALLESSEGKRGEPRNRPPFPVEKGYMDHPTIINNAETLCNVVKILKNGSEWYTMLGSQESAGTKLISVSGDCKYPGVYEVEWGIRVKDILDLAGASNIQAVQVGGPSAECIGPADFNRTISFEDLPTGGSFIIIGNKRDLIGDVVTNFLDFFIEESCGSCTVCRTMPTILKNKIAKILTGHGVQQDLEDLQDWGSKMKMANRCGLGQTAANPVLSTLKNFREKYEGLIRKDVDFDSGFDLASAVVDSCEHVGRTPNL
ncbi:MAG: NAD(P)H-dependent oxidoreductase subunit E [Bacteroidales bacterium]